MKRSVIGLMAALLLLAGATTAVAGHRDKQAILLDEVLRLSHEGVPDRLIVKQIQAMDFVFELDADDIIELRTLGVSDEVLEALIDTAIEAQEERDTYRRRHVDVWISPGFYSPWYRYPYAWAGYYDPFPSYWSCYYYPFFYGWHDWGWYGGFGFNYFAYYYDVNATYYTDWWYPRYHRGHHPHHRPKDTDPDPGLTVAREIPARPVADAPSRVPHSPAPTAAPRRGRVVRTLDVPRQPYRAKEVPAAAGPRRTPRRGELSDRMRSPSVSDDPASPGSAPAARPAQPATTPRPPQAERPKRSRLEDRRAPAKEPEQARPARRSPRSKDVDRPKPRERKRAIERRRPAKRSEPRVRPAHKRTAPKVHAPRTRHGRSGSTVKPRSHAAPQRSPASNGRSPRMRVRPKP